MIPIDPSTASHIAKQAVEGPMNAEPKADENDVANFERQTSGGVSGAAASPMEAGIGPSTATPPVNAAEESGPAGGSPGTIGDAILQGLSKVGSDYGAEVNSIDQSVRNAKGGAMSPAELLNIEYQLSEMTVEQEVTSKIGDSASQGVQQLFKNQ